jgi:hypothetical protein
MENHFKAKQNAGSLELQQMPSSQKGGILYTEAEGHPYHGKTGYLK